MTPPPLPASQPTKPVTVEQITQRVCALAAKQAGVEPAAVTVETRFVEDLQFDSLDYVDFTMALEEEFHVELPDEPKEKGISAQQEFANNPHVQAGVDLVTNALQARQQD